ncbi:LOW QUALITY PROTEIN: cullin-9 [Erpetoichthys calabaricus]|uniref:Cullin 7 n=1 Tax=Erpetoichthys calabaricus TaxID=27687 RepID=A0A8C4XGN6_ERPCA|nr:LOW QUALITY PROTEIN: cullin-9 [Erpetoichthys calabaricus]
MVGERRNGNLLVQLGPKLQAYPEELIRQRRTCDGQTEYLIRWSVLAVDEGGGTGNGTVEGAGGVASSSGGGSSSDSKSENILMWMSTEDVYANCPTLLGKRKNDCQRAVTEEQPNSEFSSGSTFDQVELSDMENDVKNLVARARKQMDKKRDVDAISITHTIHVLSAYASIGSLVGVFKETGALDLLMELLCNKERQTRRSAGKMLRALASHDAGSRAYVLLSLSQQDGIEQHMDFDNRYTLLELFAETTSTEEHGISFEGIHLPQIPGKLLFSLVKRYLCVTSLMDKLNTSSSEQNSERQEGTVSLHQNEHSRVQHEFEFTMAMANLISELVRVMGWDRNRQMDHESMFCSAEEDQQQKIIRSIFQPRSTPCQTILAAPPPKKKASNSFKARTDFATRAAYVEYVQNTLRSGMVVRMLEDYEEVSSGDEGEFRYSNDGTPPVQVYWNSLNRTYWVHWHMVEIIGSGTSGQAEKEAQEKASTLAETLKLSTGERDQSLLPVSQMFFCKPPGGLYSLPYLAESVCEDSRVLSRAEWWELLFFIKKLELKQQQEVNRLICQSLDYQMYEIDEVGLIQLPVPVEVAQKLLQYLTEHSQAATLSDLQSSHVYIKHYLRKGPLEQERLSEALNMEFGDEGPSSSLGNTNMLKKDLATDPSPAANTDVELPVDEELNYPGDIEEKMKVFNNPKIQGKKNYLERFSEVIDIMKKNSMDTGQQLAGLKFMTKVLEEETQERITLRTDSAQTIRDKLLKMLVEMLTNQSKEKTVCALQMVHALLLKYEWRVMFATEGGVKAILSSMQEHAGCPQVQQASLAALKVITGASKHDVRNLSGCLPLSESGLQMMLEIFASIGSATPKGSKGLLSAIPVAIDLMLNTQGCSIAVRNGLLVVIVLVSNHKSLAEQLVASDICSVLKRCIGKKSSSAASPEQMLSIVALSYIYNVHKLSAGIDKKEPKEELDFKDMELKMLLVSLKEMPATKEIILTLDRLICDEGSRIEQELNDIMKDKETFQALVRALDHQGVDKVLQLAALRILSKFLDSYQEDVLPWHEIIEPCLTSITVCISDREVVQQFIRLLYRLATLNKDYAVVMCRLGTKEILIKAVDKHSTNLLMVTELRDLISDCEKYAILHKKMTTSILAGCIQMVLGQIEEHRRSHQPINIPFFDVFLRNLCQGSSVELKEDKCWEKIEVSSNHHRANKLTDKNPKTYWESNGSTGSHFINIFMHKGVIIRHLAIWVAAEDTSYMPARIIVMGGDDAASINTELNTVNVPPTANRVVLLENMTRYWSIVQIRIKRCQQGGIDTRVHGFEVLGPKPTFWPVFKEQLCCRTYLFYTTKAHTWCQEILDDKMQLLQLFNKLNSALRHEQMFADRFLPDAEASEALGRTCWEALITPIVQSITVSDNTKISPLSWLLNEYLENSDAAKRSKSRAAIFNSRVRRLTHLLVHVDTSRIDTEDLKPPLKSNGKDGKNKEVTSSTLSKPKVKQVSSIAGIAQCWQGVVQLQVKKFLDSACSMDDFVQRYRNMYLRLKNAMEELFGQQTAFVIALRQGFSAALLQLTILTAMHVSERFAQYIDLMIQESGADTGNVEALNQLQQFLEPVLFLSGLELGNTFEHFYRYYLGDRLLGRGKVWLESAVIEQIGTCFPNRLPQQMLKNLRESEELQQEFHLYRLQQLDKILQDTNEEMMEVQLSCPMDESDIDVKVLVLSPRCWTVSAFCHLDCPDKYFPSQLCSYLEEFSEFYANSQNMYSLTHSKPRCLQWTWLGHAELQYGHLTLYVSTLQMFILLHFNEKNEVSVESLLQSSGLSVTQICHALKPLIEKGILLQANTSQDLSSGILKLDTETSAMESNRQTHMCLLPQQTYLNVNEDAAYTLERKRNFIYCLIVQIMKAEKELHIDNLVFKVIDTCHCQDSKKVPRMILFSCSNTDVLSCVMHLINKGYIRRNEDSPHILEYVPEDPTTPQKGQAHISFTKHGVKKTSSSQRETSSTVSSCNFSSNIRSYEDEVLEAVLFSMGRTMTQDEVRQLMYQTVIHVADTLSIASDRAQHLLIHCKWNVDLLIQRYAEDCDSLLLSAGLESRNLQAPSSLASHCPVCLSPQSGELNVAPNLCCMHYCCRFCWKEYLTTRIEQNLVLNCTCPISDCPAQPTTDFISSIITDKEIIAKYENTLLRGYVECCSNLTWCTNPQGCDQILCKEGIGNVGTCSKCCWSSCFSCNFPEAHYPASCSHMSQWMDDGGYYEGMSMEAQSKHLAKLISKRCPSCQAQIEKNEGCLHMTCAKCNHGFCWRCLKPWKPTHKDYYNCSAMVSKAARQEKKFQDYNERCTFHNQAKDFAINLENKVSSINEALQMKSLTFVIDACEILAQARKVLAYSCVYSYYNQDTEKMDVMEQQTDNLDLHTNALQILLEDTLLQCTDLASCIRLLKPEHLNTGLELIRRIQERLVAILQHSTQDFRVGYQCKSGPDHESSQSSNLDNQSDFNKEVKSDVSSDSADSDNNNVGDDDEEYDDEYVPEWHQDFDEEDIDEDEFFSEDDESENLEHE